MLSPLLHVQPSSWSIVTLVIQVPLLFDVSPFALMFTVTTVLSSESPHAPGLLVQGQAPQAEGGRTEEQA
jgi:hypothetical protein